MFFKIPPIHKNQLESSRAFVSYRYAYEHSVPVAKMGIASRVESCDLSLFRFY